MKVVHRPKASNSSSSSSASAFTAGSTDSFEMTESTSADEAVGLMGSKFALAKRQLMDLINEIRSTGAALDVEYLSA